MTTLVLRTQQAQARIEGREAITDRENDYAVIDGKVVIGRIYFGAGARADKWIWAVNGVGSALCDSLDEAKARLKVAYLEKAFHLGKK